MIPKVKHLILLVGGNPLPNAVAGRLLVEAGGRVTLVHSAETSDIAKDIKKWFAKYNIATNKPVEVEEANPHNIHTEVQTLIDEKESTGLHYTGGTKAMAVHAHRAFRDILGKSAEKTSSYLDSRTLHIVFDDGRRYDAIDCLPEPFTVQDLIDLHASLRLNPCNLPLTEAWLPNTALALAKAGKIVRKGGRKRWELPSKWQNWYKTHIDPLHRQDENGKRKSKYHPMKDEQNIISGWRFQNWKTDTVLRGQAIAFPEGRIGRVLRQELGYPSDQPQFNFGQAYQTLAAPSTIPVDFQHLEMEELCAWFESKWLEHYVASCLEHSGLFNSVSIGVELILKEAADRKSRPVSFELDVVGIRGYQVFAISCTTGGNFNETKKKLFEATMRARQLGGDEARIGLVCTNDNPSHIEGECRATIDKQIRVFGSRHLKTLQTDLSKWVTGRDR